MNRFNLISSKFNDNKSKLYFSRPEFNKILEYYLNGVSKGNWKDYAIDFEENGAYFHFYNNSSEKPLISIMKKKTRNNIKNNFQLKQGLKRFLSHSTLDELFVYLKRKNIKII